MKCDKCKFEILPNMGCHCGKYKGYKNDPEKKAEDDFRRDLENEQREFQKRRGFSTQKALPGIPLTTAATTTTIFGDGFDDWDKGKGKFKTSYVTSKCSDTHPPLKITENITVFGGAASNPMQKDCDIYVSLDFSTTHSEKLYPWNDEKTKYVHFYIPDMGVPSSASEFKKMIVWLKAQAETGKKIHIGCIGGHGRTGMVLAALVKEIGGVEDAIEYVRKNYCKKALETGKQAKWLGEHFGIKFSEGYKTTSKYYADNPVASGSYTSFEDWEKSKHSSKGGYAERHNAKYGKASDDIAYPVTPVMTEGNVWGVIEGSAVEVDD